MTDYPTILPRMLHEKHAAIELGISYVSLQRIRRAGEISYTLVGKRPRYTPEQLARYLRDQERRDDGPAGQILRLASDTTQDV